LLSYCLSRINCYFNYYVRLHITTWRKIQELGLVPRYREDDELKLFCGKLDALAFLPEDDLDEGMTHIRDITPPGAEALVDYFDQTYVTGTYRRAGRGNVQRGVR
jgi:hypothetical protein